MKAGRRQWFSSSVCGNSATERDDLPIRWALSEGVTVEFLHTAWVQRAGGEAINMAYSERARELRRCKAIKPNGERCKAWARWGDPRQLCVAHGGGHHTGPLETARGIEVKTVPVCHCDAYAWPHRPGGGLCRWPDPPTYVCTIPAGTHPYGRFRGLNLRRLRQTRRVIHVRPVRRDQAPGGEVI